MFDAAIKALTQMFSPPFRRVLLKSIGLGADPDRADRRRAQPGVFLDGARAAQPGPRPRPAPIPLWQILAWVLSIAATLGIITGALFLMPAVTAFVGSFFVDEIADEVERTHYPMEPPGTALPLFRALIEGINTALLAVLVYLVAVPFLFVAGLGLVIMFLANAYLLSREYFLLAAMRFRPPDEAKAMRRAYRGQIFLAGLLIAMFVSIPIVNLATPLFAMAMMVHMHKRLSQRRVTFQPKRA